jgi:hypothetical protein
VQEASRFVPAWQPDFPTLTPASNQRLTCSAAPVDSATGRSWSACCSVASTTVDPESSSMYASCLQHGCASDPAIVLISNKLVQLPAGSGVCSSSIQLLCSSRCMQRWGYCALPSCMAQAWHSCIRGRCRNDTTLVCTQNQRARATMWQTTLHSTKCRRSLWRVVEAERHRHPAGQPGAP